MGDPSDERPMLVLEHIGCEPPAAYEQELRAQEIPLHRVRLHEGDELPDWREHRGIVAMGGPMGVHDEALHRWLAPEKRLIGEAVRAGVPYWGVCLGAQLLAASLGARVAAGPAPEVGVLPVMLTPQAANDPVFGGLPHSFPAFHWHGDTYELPAGAVWLASSEQYEQQAFVFQRAYAIQFHLEVDAALVAQWCEVAAYADDLQRLPGEEPAAVLLGQLAAIESQAMARARTIFGRWLMSGGDEGREARVVRR
jgi:GMP synthase (glutamine-hydrolysing)